MTSEPLALWLILLHVPKSSPRKILDWLVSFTSIQDFFAAGDHELQNCGLTKAQIDYLRKPDEKEIAQALKWLEEDHQHTIIPYDHADYPALLKEIAHPPLLLFVKGNFALLNRKQIAIVGTRYATFTGLKNAEFFAAHLAQAGLVITSGLARGIDSASHQGALRVKGETVAVLGAGLFHVYPKSNRGLAAEIVAQGGALVSEFPLTMAPFAANFPRRNRIIAGLALGVLVVEAALKSGSLITARIALEEGRDIFAIPGTIHQPLSLGCHHLIKQGAKLVDAVTDILEELPGHHLGALQSKMAPKKLVISPQAMQILEQIDYEITPIDVILLRSQLTGSEVYSILLKLELQGLIQVVSGGYVKIAAQKI